MRPIPPSLLAKIQQQNQTIWNNANPKMSIQVSRAKDTVMDSTYWTVETIREKAGLGDLSIAARRRKAHGPPDRLYNIYVDNGVVKTATREYPDYQKLKWQPGFELGSGTAVAIAFDGHWELYKDKWQMVTSEEPWLFWVDGGILYAQYWDDINTKFQLSTGVSKIKAIRGWVNVNMPEVDQGVIAGYIKSDSKVYYRNYCYQVSSDAYAWENEVLIEEFTGTAINLNLFITNDYRMGFIIEDSLGKIHWIITERAWAGMAIAPEYLSVTPVEITAKLMPIEHIIGYHEEYLSVAPAEISAGLLFANTENEILYAMNSPITMVDEDDEEYENWGFVIEFEVENPIVALPLASVTLIDIETGSQILISSVEKIDDYNFKIFIDDSTGSGINNVFGDIKININGATNEAGYSYESMEYAFTPINLEPEDFPIPELEAIWNE